MRVVFACCFIAAFCAPCGAQTRHAPGFRLLVLDGQVAKWPAGKVVKYAILTARASFAKARNCGTMTPLKPVLARSGVSPSSFELETAAAFRLWESAANITFRRVESAKGADILIGAQGEPRGRAFTNVKLTEKGKEAPGIAQSLICLNPKTPWKVGFDGDLSVYDLRYTLAHEIGHAIGLDHPGSSGELMGYKYDETSRNLTVGDVTGAVRLYGLRVAPVTRVASVPSGRRVVAKTSRKPSALGLGEAVKKRRK